jgi:hypothetical protein
MSPQAWTEMLRQQGVRVANASRTKRHEELERYLRIEESMRIAQARASTGAEASLPLFADG